ncbi:MAG: menaquinone biosynthesis protein [Bacteroidales bacterium]|nr:menaquinone biosynthesis protein [Bacteroidales bacterium]
MTKKKYKISTISYINTFPFLYLLEKKGKDFFDIEIDYPSKCAEKLLYDKVDIGLIPVAAITELPYAEIITNYCIGANGKVNTVALLSNDKIEDIESIYLDYQSKTSVNLMRILAIEYYKKDINWITTKPGFEQLQLPEKCGMVIIGDRVFEMESKFKYKYDLAEEWEKHTGMPFVFAAWVTNKKLPTKVKERLNKIFSDIDKIIELSIDKYSTESISDEKRDILIDYLTNNIVYHKSPDMKSAMERFLSTVIQLSKPIKTNF